MWRGIIVMLASLGAAAVQSADTTDGYWYVQTSVWTRHFSPEPDHNNRQKLIGVERHAGDNWLWGGSTLLNSFDQRSVYAYGGRTFDLVDTPFYAKLTGGLLWGYRGEYQDKIPLNDLGIAPAILPSVGASWHSFGAEIIVFGTAGTMVTMGYRF